MHHKRLEKRWLGLAGVLLLATLGGCKQPDTNQAETNGGNAAPVSGSAAAPYSGSDILIGEYGDLTGKTAQFGESTRDGIALAVEEINARGGVLGKKVRIQLEDNSGSPQQTSQIVKKLIDQNNVLAILGEVASSRSIAGAKICQPAGVPMISPTSTNPEVTEIGDYIFRTCFVDPFQGTVNARFALNNLKVKSAAVLTDVKNAYSVGLSKFFIEEFQKNGGKIVGQENYKEGDENFRSQLTSLKAKNPEVIFVPGYYNDVAVIAKQARALGIRQPMLGGDGWDAPELLQIGGSAVQNCYFSTHASSESGDPRMMKFVADFKKKFNQEPNALAAVAYDAANLMFDAIKRADGTDRAKIRDAIAATKDFPGVTGDITIDKNRNAIKQVVMMKVENGQFKYVATVKP